MKVVLVVLISDLTNTPHKGPMTSSQKTDLHYLEIKNSCSIPAASS